MKIQWSWRTSHLRLSPSHVQQFRCVWHSQSHNFTNHYSHTQSTSTDDWYLCASAHNWVFSPTSIRCLSCFLSNWCRVYRCGSGPDCLDVPIPTSAPSAQETPSTFTHPSLLNQKWGMPISKASGEVSTILHIACQNPYCEEAEPQETCCTY